MTREEAIIEAGIEYSIQNSPYCIGGDNFYEKARELNRNKSFEAGVIWADSHPKSPWISVKERLPTKGGHYLCVDENYNIAVLAFVGDKWINTKTFTDVPLDVVIYWMPKPPLPKE